VVGACFVRGDMAVNAEWSCFALAISRVPSMDTDKDISQRTRQFAVDASWAPAEIFDAAGCAIITDA